MIPLQTVCEYLDQFAPPALAEDWDNVGFLVGDPQRSIRRIMTCLTVTPASADDLRAEFLLFGESSAVVVGDERLYSGRDELDYFVTHPASENERDWLSLEPMH